MLHSKPPPGNGFQGGTRLFASAKRYDRWALAIHQKMMTGIQTSAISATGFHLAVVWSVNFFTTSYIFFVAPQQLSATICPVSSIPKKWIYARLVRAFFLSGQPGKTLFRGSRPVAHGAVAA
jgi:hypothetical protein